MDALQFSVLADVAERSKALELGSNIFGYRGFEPHRPQIFVTADDT